jgi:ribosomal protein L13
VDHLSYKTAHANKATVEKYWVIVDAKKQGFGRIACQFAIIIRGMH